MKKIAKRIVDRIYYYFEMMDVELPAFTREAVEKVVTDELKRNEKRAAMRGREESEDTEHGQNS